MSEVSQRKRILRLLALERSANSSHSSVGGLGPSATEIAHRLQISPASASSLLCKLAARGVVGRSRINGTWRYYR